MTQRDASRPCCWFCKKTCVDDGDVHNFYHPILDVCRSSPRDRVYNYVTQCKKCDIKDDIYARNHQGDRRQWTTRGWLEVDPQTNAFVDPYYKYPGTVVWRTDLPSEIMYLDDDGETVLTSCQPWTDEMDIRDFRPHVALKK